MKKGGRVAALSIAARIAPRHLLWGELQLARNRWQAKVHPVWIQICY
jgi:hypothetical protein